MEQEVCLDVSGLEPPEPLVLTINYAQRLQPGQVLRMIHRRFPCLLEKNLHQLGFCCRITEYADEVVTLIWLDGDEAAKAYVEHAGTES